MELILISSSKLKIMLSDSDMEKYDLDAENADYDNTATRRAFWSILDDVKNRTGFDAANDRVFIQLYPSKEGGCEMFVTKMGLLCSANEGAHSMILENANLTKERLSAFSFDGIEPVLGVSRCLKARKWRGKSAAFRDENGKYYLILCERTADFAEIPGHLSFIREYGKPEDAGTLGLYIKEHGFPVCTDHAVQVLGKL